MNAIDLPAAGRRFIDRPELDEYAGERLAGLVLPGLFVVGSLDGLAAPTVAIVGTRAPSEGGRERARRLAHELGANGICIVSGLALGIDAAAHEGALLAGAPTIGVLGGGHDHFFPPRNAELARRIVASGGAVVSPFAPHEPARPYQFLQRNGIVAALADAVVVVEAAARSGALNTASWAADRSLPVLAFPGDVDRPKVAGCLALIRDGAVLVRGADDVLDALGRQRESSPRAQPRSPRAATPIQGRVFAAIGAEGATCESLAQTTGLGIGELLGTLGECELHGTIVREGDRYRMAPPSPRGQ